ncbi:MFS transporter [Rhizobium leguminosarum]|uniref:MFS transporter n=1 Tax=Rhizobium TaxID=379 RepID=UPI00103083DE|nr:MFS transporter [Rhizobium leguminosarum]TBF87430.1 MFS transporter [Rhizobium leguminosarum]TBG07045.1 MFS transporter [Rhizobium leguminosarum]TBG07805.1 MFS transporter [Rhizobium leguminosarum]TBG30736.1 MFS transporter [Rhizobium leguminosarum]TBG50104.1 MFS transporter [Rhizobium leguminosarum]
MSIQLSGTPSAIAGDRGASDPTVPTVRLLALVVLGGTLEFYDFIIFIFLAPEIGRLFFPDQTTTWAAMVQTYGIFGLGYLVRPLGGIILAHFGDLFGRRWTFLFSILLMCLATIGIALLPTYQTIGVAAPILLVILRLMQGAAIGGEVPGAWTFISEHLPLRRVGLGCGMICSGFGFGILLGTSINAAIDALLSADAMMDFGWRIPFLIGGVFGLIAVYLRIWLRETPVFAEMARQRMLVSELPLKVVLRNHKPAVIVAILLTWYLSAGIVVTTLMTPTFLRVLYGYTAQQALAATSIGAIFVIIGTVCSGALIDKIGTKSFFLYAGLMFAVATTAFYSLAGVSVLLGFALNALLGLAVGMNAGVPFVMVRSFPARIRFSGVSFSYNLSYAFFGGLTPVAITSLLPFNSMAHLYFLLIIALITFAVGIYLRKTAHRFDYPVGIEEQNAYGPDATERSVQPGIA